MDVQSGETEEEEVIGLGEGMGELEWQYWYQNEADKETDGVDSRDKVKHNGRSDQLFLEKIMKVAEQE